MYNWLRDNYADALAQELEEQIENGEITEDKAQNLFNIKMENWMADYSDYMYDMASDR